MKASILLFSAIALCFLSSLPAQEATAPGQSDSANAVPDQAVSPDAQAVLDRMTTYLRTLQAFSITSSSTRDEVLPYGYKLQNAERSEVIVQRPDKLRAEITGDIRNRTIVYDGTKLAMYSPDDAAYVQMNAPETLGKLIGRLLDAGVDMPLIDVIYQAADGSLTEQVLSGVLVGDTSVDGIECDHLAFRQASVDWQLWVEKGARPLPHKILITTRYQVGDPQFQSVLTWNLKPKIDKATFAFAPPKGSSEVPYTDPASFGNVP